jgi:hypothetical protein
LQIVSFRESKIPGSKSSGKFFTATVRSVVGEHFYVQFKGRDYINMNYPVPQDKQGSLWKHGVGARERLIGPDRMLDRRDESTRIALDDGAAVGFSAVAAGGEGGVAPPQSPPLPTSPPPPLPPRLPTSPPDSPRQSYVPTSPPESPRSPPRKMKKRSSDDSRIAEEALRAFKRPAPGGGGGGDGAAGGGGGGDGAAGGDGGCGGLPVLKAGSLITLLDMWDKETNVMDLTPTPGVVTCVNRSTFDYRVLDKKAAAGSGKLLGADVRYTTPELRNEVWLHGADFSAVSEEQRAEFMAAVEDLGFH